ncbi:MAG TPA: non-homologous end-joining DNA ligase, partial [Acidobacteriota bacterium]|nr:non-homologous end-joining DNA ligase [Acidobacteriota bacterium]
MSPKTELKIDGRTLQVSNLDKPMFPDGFTKGQVIDYYIRISPVLLPHLKDRPITMVRFPDGVMGPHFYEKDAPKHTPDWIKRVPVERKGGGKPIHYILINDLPSLVWSANLANLEMHTFLARWPRVDQPTMIVFDLDPGPPATAIECAQVALWLKEIFDSLKLKSFVKFSGSKGIQLYIPLNTPVTYDTTATFSKAIADFLHEAHPEAVVSEMAKKLRGGKVFIDWSQNSETKTTACVYSLRAKQEHPYISVPLTWDELEKLLKKGDPSKFLFEPEEELQRVDRLGDLFEPINTLKQKIPVDFMKKLEPPRTKAAARKGRTQGSAGTTLKEYNRKRDFNQTAEPPGEVVEKQSKDGSEHMYVIQKHEATRLHYDFRLEMQGVLRSWAVPKGIPTSSNDKRLAMHVEDHPMEYARFEGTIPKGNYGGGTVMVWDIGTYKTMEQNPVAAYYAGKLHLIMDGKKLHGEWILVRTSRNEGREWLLMKKGETKPISAKQDDTSVLTGRSMKKIASDNDAQWISNRPPKENTPKNRLKARLASKDPLSKFEDVLKNLPAGKPKFVEPMLSKPVNKLPDGKEWIYEIKFDGYRAEAIRNGKSVDLISRNAKNMKQKYPEIVDGLNALPEKDFLIDGEIVALNEEGVPSFQLLQNLSQTSDRPLHFFAFDLLNYDGKNLINVPLFQRKEILQALLESSDGSISYSAAFEADPKILEQEVRKRGLEGIVAKRKESKYEPGKRTGAWVKYKTDAGQEFVIGGYKPSDRSSGLDSILVGYYDGKKLLY